VSVSEDYGPFPNFRLIRHRNLGEEGCLGLKDAKRRNGDAAETRQHAAVGREGGGAVRSVSAGRQAHARERKTEGRVKRKEEDRWAGQAKPVHLPPF